MDDELVRTSLGEVMRRATIVGVALCALGAPIALRAQAATSHSGAADAAYDSSMFAALTWRQIGPFRGGRSVTVAGSASRPHEYYMGTTGGGVFKTTDGGETWLPITDKFFGGTIGAVAISESSPDIVYVGTGE